MTTTDIQKAKAESKKGAALVKSTQKPGTLAGLKSTDIGDYFNQYKAAIQQALPKKGEVDRFIQIVTTLVARNPAIAECTIQSIIGAAIQSASLGLNPSNNLGECYLVPFNNKVKLPGGRVEWRKEVQFIIGYKGLLKLARNSGQIKDVYAEEVYEGDTFKMTLGLERDLVHEPSDDPGREDRPVTHVYAVARYKDGGINFVVLTVGQVEKYRLRSQGQKPDGKTGAWKTDFEAMAKKTALRRLSTYMPLSDTEKNVIASDEKVLRLETGDEFTEGFYRSELAEEYEDYADYDDVTDEVTDEGEDYKKHTQVDESEFDDLEPPTADEAEDIDEDTGEIFGKDGKQ